MSASPSTSALHERVLEWYAAQARDLPWRRPDASPWGVFVSEIMLQQTPVARVEPVWRVWMERWPDPAALAAEPPGEAVRAWGRLGYPRRALRLHAAATAMVASYGGRVPDTEETLLTLPGVGTYTAAAVATFAFGERTVVVDTNVRRVLARVVGGEQYPPRSPTRTELAVAAELVPLDPSAARTWSVAVMELGALVCSARAPRCGDCPVAAQCRWRAAGHPPHTGAPRKGQAWAGTDRMVRGALLAVLRASDAPVERSVLDAVPAEPDQRERCLDSLVADGLVEPLEDGFFRLPGERRAS